MHFGFSQSPISKSGLVWGQHRQVSSKRCSWVFLSVRSKTWRNPSPSCISQYDSCLWDPNFSNVTNLQQSCPGEHMWQHWLQRSWHASGQTGFCRRRAHGFANFRSCQRGHGAFLIVFKISTQIEFTGDRRRMNTSVESHASKSCPTLQHS